MDLLGSLIIKRYYCLSPIGWLWSPAIRLRRIRSEGFRKCPGRWHHQGQHTHYWRTGSSLLHKLGDLLCRQPRLDWYPSDFTYFCFVLYIYECSCNRALRLNVSIDSRIVSIYYDASVFKFWDRKCIQHH